MQESKVYFVVLDVCVHTDLVISKKYFLTYYRFNTEDHDLLEMLQKLLQKAIKIVKLDYVSDILIQPFRGKLWIYNRACIMHHTLYWRIKNRLKRNMFWFYYMTTHS